MERITSGGLRMPKLGLGTWRMRGAACQAAAERALELGYRHVDTAQMYGNEDAVGAALRASGVARDEVHVTSKVWHDRLTPAGMQRALDESLAALGCDYLDLYLVHWPSPAMDLPRVVETLVGFRAAGRVRAIGVSNFPVALLRQAAALAEGAIACNQVEYHVLLDQSAVLEAARALGVAVVAYAPLAQGRLADYPALQRVAAKHGATPAQVALKWLLDQQGVGAIPKAARAESQRANLEALRLALDDDDRAAIAGLPKDQRFLNPDWAPEWDPPQRRAG